MKDLQKGCQIPVTYVEQLPKEVSPVRIHFITLGAHAQRGYGSWVCVCVCLSVT